MPAIRVSQPPCLVIIFSKEESRVSIIGCILAEKPIYREQEPLRLLQCERREGAAPVCCALVVQVCLQIGHQESRRGPFPANIADHQPQPLSTEIKKVIVVPAYVASLDADTRIVETRHVRLPLREKSCLYLSRGFQFV